MSDSYPELPIDEGDAKYYDGYTYFTGLSIWTWDESITNWVVTPRPDVPDGYGD